jgi:hypothetical protein
MRNSGEPWEFMRGADPRSARLLQDTAMSRMPAGCDGWASDEYPLRTIN